MTPDEMQRTRQGVDQMYGDLKPGGYPVDPTGNSPGAPMPDSKAVFVDQIDGDTATLMMGQKAVNVPLSVLPKGAREGMYFDPDTGAVMDDPNDHATERKRARLMQDDGGDVDLGGDQ